MANYDERIQKLISNEQKKIEARNKKEDSEKKAEMERYCKRCEEIRKKFLDYIINTIENENTDEKTVRKICFEQLYRDEASQNFSSFGMWVFKTAIGIKITICYEQYEKFPSQTIYKEDKEAIDLFGTVKVKEIASNCNLIPHGILWAHAKMLDGFLELRCWETRPYEKSHITVEPNYEIKILN